MLAEFLVGLQSTSAIADAGAAVYRSQQFSDLAMVAFGQCRNRGPRAAQADAEEIGMFQLQRLRKAWHDFMSCGLVDAIAHCVL